MFEVRVLVKNTRARGHYCGFQGLYRHWEKVKMFHIDARTPEQAGEKAKRYGRPLTIRKADITKMYGDITRLKLDQKPLVDMYQQGSPYSSAIAMDEMIWQKKNRKKRVKNREKDKKSIDI